MYLTDYSTSRAREAFTVPYVMVHCLHEDGPDMNTQGDMNPIPRRFIESTPELTPVYDAFEEGRSDAFVLIVGMPCTYDNGRDNYGGKVILATPTKIVADLGALGEVTFRPRSNQRASGWMRSGRACGWILVGEARPYVCREA